MAQPTISSVHVDVALTNYSLAYMQKRENFIASQVFPTVPVEQQSNKYYTYTKQDWFRDEAQVRPPATESAGSGYNLSTDSYYCDVYAIHKDVNDQTTANEDAALNGERSAAEFVTQRILVKKEREWASTFFATSVWGTDKTGTTDFVKWDVLTTSKPLVDVQAGVKTILTNTGMEPNTLVLGYDVYSALINHPDFIDRLRGISSDRVGAQVMANLFGIPRVLVCKAVYASNVEGAAATMAFVQGKHALLAYVDPSPTIETATAGLTYVWRGATDGQAAMGADVGTVRFEIPEKRVTRVEAQAAWDSKVVATDLGYFFASAVS